MEQLRKMNLPLAGRIQHGEQTQVNNKKKVVEYGYFIPKIQESNLQFLANRFNELYNKKTAIPIRIINEDPFSVKRIRYNQGGAACYCMNGQEQGKQKISNVWKPITCKEDCAYRIKQDGAQKPACNKEGILIFMLPQINDDRIWYMKITSQEAIDKLNTYFKLQKSIGKSVKGDYIVYLKQKEQITSEGKKFNNFIVDIIKKEDLNSNNSIQNVQENKISKPSNTQKNIEQPIPETNKNEVKEQEDIKQETKTKTTTNKKTSKKSSTDNEKNIVVEQKEIKEEQIKNETNDTNMDNYYMLYQTSTKQLMKNGKPTEYIFGSFVNIDNEVIDVAIPPNLKEEFLKCDTGTSVELELGKSGTLTFAKDIKYNQKILKNIAA